MSVAKSEGGFSFWIFVISRMLYTIVDIETTGNGLKGNCITEISMFKFDGEQIVDEFTSLVNPNAPIPYYITSLTGIDDGMVKNAPTFAEIADKVLAFTKDGIFIAHSVNFDYGVIKEEFRRIGIDFVRKKLCTVRLSRKLVPGFQSYSLGKLCSSLDIPLQNRHRARGDAHATVLLFQLLLGKADAAELIQKSLNARSQEAVLPPHLPKSVVNSIPQEAGIYYFKNTKGEIIYVGKAKNLKKRVLGHFYDKSEKELKLCRETADISFETTGSELVALLKESAEIKKHYPRYNSAQKKPLSRFAIFSYEDRNGILHLAFNRLKHAPNPLKLFYNITDCRNYLSHLCEQHGLCPKYCHLTSETICSDPVRGNCSGICTGKLKSTAYNLKVEAAIAHINDTSENSYLLREKGRHTGEQAFVFLERGQYRGYGFINREVEIHHWQDIEAFLIPQKNTPETQRIVESFLPKYGPQHFVLLEGRFEIGDTQTSETLTIF
ncbi:MAG: exonuclease domain-containing protein [Bacteroidota bacterium]